MLIGGHVFTVNGSKKCQLYTFLESRAEVASVSAETITSLLQSCPALSTGDSFYEQQQKDIWIWEVTLYLEHGNCRRPKARVRK